MSLVMLEMCRFALIYSFFFILRSDDDLFSFCVLLILKIWYEIDS